MTGPIERTPLLQDPKKVSRSSKNTFRLSASLLQAQSVFSMPVESSEEDWGGLGGTGAAFPSLQGSLPTHGLASITQHVDEDVKQPEELKQEAQEVSACWWWWEVVAACGPEWGVCVDLCTGVGSCEREERQQEVYVGGVAVEEIRSGQGPGKHDLPPQDMMIKGEASSRQRLLHDKSHHLHTYRLIP